MSDMVYIQDDFGNRIPMLDGYGNLSVQVVMLYTEDKLSETDRRTVSDFAAVDEMANDALEGFALTSNAPKTRYHLGQLNNDIQKRTGAAAVNALPRQQSDFNYRKLAAAIAVLVAIGGATFLGIRYFGENKLADNTKLIPVEESQSETATVIQESDNMEESAGSISLSEKDVTKLKPSSLPDAAESAKAAPTASVRKTSEDAKKVAETTDKKSNTEKLTAARVLVEQEKEEDVEQSELADTETVIEEFAENNRLAQSGSVSKDRKEVDAYNKQQQKLKEDVNAANARADRVLKTLEQQALAAEQKREEPKGAPNASSSAAYPGGDIEMYKFIERKKIYTEAMKALELQGTVKISFDIEPDGRVSNAKVKAGENGLMNEDALRVIRSMPQWKPANDANGEAIRSSKTVTIKYGQ